VTLVLEHLVLVLRQLQTISALVLEHLVGFGFVVTQDHFLGTSGPATKFLLVTVPGSACTSNGQQRRTGNSYGSSFKLTKPLIQVIRCKGTQRPELSLDFSLGQEAPRNHWKPLVLVLVSLKGLVCSQLA